MIRSDGFAQITAAATVPEQIVPYVKAVSDSRPLMARSCIAYQSGTELVLVGYPLGDPTDEKAMVEAVDEALLVPWLSRITVMGPALPPQAPAAISHSKDSYSFIQVPPPPPGQKLRNMLRRAGRELTVEKGRIWEAEHAGLVRKYLETRTYDPGTVHIFNNIPAYLTMSYGSLVFSARKRDGTLAAVAVGEFGTLETAFFMFCFRDQAVAPPGSTDLLLLALLDEAAERGHARMNLGLGINEGVRFFKRKWGEGMELPYFQASWDIIQAGLFSRLKNFFEKRKDDR